MDNRVWFSSYDDGTPTTIEYHDTTLVDNLYRAAREYPNRPALIFLNSSITYAQLLDAVERLATALVALGVQPGSRVAIDMPNLPQFVIAYYGILRAGAIATPTNPLYTTKEIEHQWSDSGSTIAIVADFIYAQRVAPIKHKLQIQHFIIASIPEYLRFPLNWLAPLKLKRQDPPLIANVESGPHVHHFRKLIEGTTPAPPPKPSDVSAVATLLYTGGTTGVSKGAALTHRNLAYNAEQISQWVSWTERGEEVLLTMLPLFRSYGLTVAMSVGLCLAESVGLS